MDKSTVLQLIKERFESLSKQECIAANYILAHPNKVAVMSMRDLARLSAVAPATMTRLAKRLGLSGYEPLKSAFVETMRSQGSPYGGRAQKMVLLNEKIGERAHVQELIHGAVDHIQRIYEKDNVDAIIRAARKLRRARQIHCLGLRSSFAVAYQLSHVASYFAGNVRLVDGAGDSGVMTLLHQTSTQDIALVCSLPRYSRRAVALAGFLHKKGVPIIAITDSPTSPVGRLACETILVGNGTASFFDTIVPALLVTEILIALLATDPKTDTEARVSASEAQLTGLDEWWDGR
ncbi:MurR/RpiR family transcriptional regulator [Robbsia sp. Bb-Pol-6]|uniref:MurR/RpiR family transcriptional regulator n=1 Tax=Robbsia betulipollinis TaxID=2981849 RepID=A0ABT3ZJ68_9BURK|nr:MurR/RpiR family transcriptional regulator [Robbsia betulipollinis]MCY0386487.1 MurR/RpiR family transcriptional regulator [Robbsia betulipollinis]